jgi:type IV pilus assembly protein PilW
MSTAMTTNQASPGSVRTNRRSAGGFTLIEMMIAVTLGVIILAALTTFFVQVSANRSEMERGGRQIENGRFAVDTLREDLTLAGFYGDIQQDLFTWTQPAACQTAIGGIGFSGTAMQLPIPLFGYADGSGAPACVADAAAGSDVLVIRRFNTEPAAVAAANAAQFYVQISHCRTDSSTTPIVVAAGSSAGSFVLREVDCSTPARLWKFREHVYYIRSFSAAAGDGIPTLVRLELDAGATKVVPLVEGIQAMRIEYGIDNDGNGSADTWSRCSAAAPCTLAQWTGVTAVRLNLLSSNLEPSPDHTDVKVYDLGLAGTLGPFNDRFKRHVYSAVVNAVNRSEIRER